MKNIGVAFHNFASSHGKFPSYGRFNLDNSGNPTFPMNSWVVYVAAALDRRDIHDRWNRDFVWNQDVLDTKEDNLGLAETQVAVLTCPDDDSAFKRLGGLSYVVNAGYEDGNLNTFHDWDSEAVNWDGTGIAGDANDAAALAKTLARLCLDASYRRELGRRGSEGVRRHYSVSEMARQSVAVFEKLATREPVSEKQQVETGAVTV